MPLQGVGNVYPVVVASSCIPKVPYFHFTEMIKTSSTEVLIFHSFQLLNATKYEIFDGNLNV